MFGDLVVARTRGAPVEPERGSTPTLARRFHALRRALEPLIAGALASATDPLERRAVVTIRDGLEWFDEWEPVPGRVGSTNLPGGIDDDPAVGRLRRTVLRRYGRAASAVRVGAESLDRLTVLDRLTQLEDPAERRRHFEALEPVWRSIDGDGGLRSPYRELTRATARRWERLGSPIEASAVATGLPDGALEPMLWSILEAWREVAGPTPMEPWDHWHANGAAARRLDGRIPVERLRPINDAFLGVARGGPRPPGDRVRHLPPTGPATRPRGVHDGPGRGSRRGRRWVAASAGLGLRDVRDGRARQPARAAPRERARDPRGSGPDAAGVRRLPDGVVRVHRGDRRCRRLGRGRAGLAGTLAGSGRRLPGRRHATATARSSSTCAGRCSRSPSTATRTADRTTYGPTSRPAAWASSPIPSGRGGRCAASSSTGRATSPTTRSRRSSPPPSGAASASFAATGPRVTRAGTRRSHAALFEMGSERDPADLLRDFLGGPVTAEPLLADLRRAAE